MAERVAGEKLFANLGCGPKRGRQPSIFDGWRELRVDIEPAINPDIVADITDLSPIPSNSVDGVWSSHCLEHLYQHQVPVALGEITRILAPGGVACLLVPDLQAIAAYIAADKIHEPVYESPAGPICPHDVVFGFGKQIANGFTHMAHRCGFTPSAMVAYLKGAAFGQCVVMRRQGFELAALAHKTAWTSEGEREAMVRLLQS
jgi:predicted SAM-dependent methyltransferase